MSFFASLNFTRTVILLSFLASAVLGYMTWKQMEELTVLGRQVDVEAPILVNKIQNKALELNDLQGQADKEGLREGVNDPEIYIREVAGQPQVSIGQVDISPSRRPVGKGVVDRNFKIVPQDKKRSFRLLNIANFLYRLEEKSRRVKVTSLKLDPVDRLKVDQYGQDKNWTFDATVTSRQAEDEVPR